MTTIELNLPDDLLLTLKHQAEARKASLDTLIIDVLRDYLAEPTNAQILQNIRVGMKDALIGNTRSAREFLDEL